MKIKNLFFAALSILILAACTDTPDSPYDFPGIGGNDNPTEEGTNLLVNSDFETWENNVPTGWGQTVSNCTYTQSTDAHSGSSAVVVEGYSQSNKRFASKSYTLKPGTYTISAYMKKSGEALGQYRLGYAKLTNGVVADTQNDYVYITSATTVPSDWKKATCNFTIDAETEVGIIIMNSKYGEGASILVDDVTLTTTDGGLVEGTDEPETPTDAYISETFATSFGAFTTQETVGNYPWIIDYSTAKATSYESDAKTDNAAVSWLISPAVDFTNETEAYVAFEYIIQYALNNTIAENHKLLVCADYAGDAATATWTNIPYGATPGGKTADGKTDWNTFYKANVAVPAEFLGKNAVTFALCYTGTEEKAATWEVKNFVVAHGAATGETPEEPETPETPDTPVVPSGENMLANGSFEDWSGDIPVGIGGGKWHNATISQSDDAHTGNYSVIVNGDAKNNKRLATKTYVLAAGTYTFSIYYKANGAEAGLCRIGYVPIENGQAVSTKYTYETAAASAAPAEWTPRVFEFTLTEQTEVAFVIMNNKAGNGASFLVDDASLTTADGSISGGGNEEGGEEEGGEEEGGEEPETPSAGGEYLNETFATDLGSFKTQEVVGNFPWVFAANYGAKASGYSNGASQDAESWLISPAINLTGETAANIAFDYVINKGDANAAATNHKLLVTSNYTGDVTTTEWVEVEYGAVNNNNWTFHNTGEIALPGSVMGKSAVVVAFKYMSTTANSSTWEVKNVVVSSATK